MTEPSKLLLDTHIWIWLMEDTGDLADPIVAKINRAAKLRRVYVAAISFWEVCMLAEKRRVDFKKPVVNWLEDGLMHPGVNSCALTPAIACEACNLPGKFHGDPADRLIVATARILKATVVTRDKDILRYGKAGHIETLSA